MKSKILLILLIFCGVNLNAASITSVSGGGNWSYASTWIPVGVPTASDDVIITSPVVIDGDVEAKSITINADGGELSCQGLWNSSQDEWGNEIGGQLPTSLTISELGSFEIIAGTGDTPANGIFFDQFANNTVYFLGSGSISGPVTFTNLVLTGATNFTTDNITVQGILELSGSSAVVSGKSPNYFDSNSKLLYTGTGAVSTGLEWVTGAEQPGMPAQVELSGSTSLAITGNSPRTIDMLTIGNGSSVALSSENGGDLYLNYSLNTNITGTIDTKTRLIKFIGYSGDISVGSNFLYDVEINNVNNALLHTNLNIGHSLVFTDGLLETYDKKVILVSGATVSESSGKCIVGEVQSTMTVGTGAVSDWAGLGVALAAGADSPGTVVLTRLTGTKGIQTVNGKSGIAATWSFDKVINRNLTFGWYPGFDNGKTLTTAHVWGSPSVSSVWGDLSGSDQDASSHSITSTNTTSKFFTVSDATNPLAVIAPTTQTSDIVFSSIESNKMTIGWTNGNGNKRAVFVKEGVGTISNPADNTTYTASSNWVSKGTQLEASEYYCVYNNSGSSVTLTGLKGNSGYAIQIFEYNGTAISEVYNTSTAADNPQSQSTLPEFAGGDGTVADPYQIETDMQLNKVRNYLSSFFILMNDIDLSGSVYLEVGNGWNPIGNINTDLGSDWDVTNAPFTGNFNGNGHNISNLTITRGQYDAIPAGEVGLFGTISPTSAITGLGLLLVNISGDGNAGGIAGTNKGTITNCYVEGDISADDYVGGLIGILESGTVSKSYSSGTVTALATAGGIVGLAFGGTLENCYARNSISASEAGGLIGRLFGSVVSKCFATDLISGGGAEGGLFGENPGYNITSCFWDTETSLQESSAGGGGDFTGATGKTTAEMKSKSTFTGWDFETPVWSLKSDYNDGYPNLDGQVSALAAPTTQASEIVFSTVKSTEMTIGWTNGNGAKRVVFINEGTGTITNPSDNSTYTASSDWALKGTQLGTSEYYCVYNNTSNSVTITGLSISTEYTVQVFEYNGSDAAEIYNTNTTWHNPKSQYSGFNGEGTAGDPYQIFTAAELERVATNVNTGTTYLGVYFKLMNDLDLSAYSNWTPIGTDRMDPFKGSFDGNIKKITGLTISETASYRGLFGCVGSGATIKDLTVENCTISASSYVGGIAGVVYLNSANASIIISNCHVSGSISSGSVYDNNYVGGLIGCVRDENTATGGDSYNIFINDCSSTANVSHTSSGSYIGGLIGSSEGISETIDPRISRCFSSGSVTDNVAGSYVGGFIGYSLYSKISDCYSTTAVTPSGYIPYAAGFIGYAEYSVIGTSYSAGLVTGTGTYISEFIGFVNTVTATACYWDLQKSTNTSSGAGTGKTTAELKMQSTFEAGSWDFAATPIWNITSSENDGYPHLNWQVIPVVAPTTQATWISFSAITITQMTIGWTNGNGAKRAVFVKEGTGAITNPTDNTSYTATNDWTMSKGGTQLGESGYYCVYNDNSNSVTLAGLKGNTTYTVQVFEYTGSNGAQLYNTETAYLNPKSQLTTMPDFLVGVGTSESPYQITTVAQLNKVRDYLLSSFILMNDLDLAGSDYLEDRNGWNPIGNINILNEGSLVWEVTNTPFTGNFNGNGHSISNLTITRGKDNFIPANQVGLFGSVSSISTIKGLGLLSVNITGMSMVGGLAGTNKGVYTNCYVTGSITGDNNVGGLVGYLDGGTISKSHSSGVVTATDTDAETTAAGGCIGLSNGGKIENCYARNSVSAHKGGGLIGINYGADISHCFATGQITNDMSTGGLVAHNPSMAGSDSFWDTETSGQSGSTAGTGKTTAEMKTLSTFSGWDFTTPVWSLKSDYNDGYPNLDGQVSALAAPTTQASEIVFSTVKSTEMTIGWTNGNGTKRAVFLKQANTGTTTPVDLNTYTANTVFTSGTPISSTTWYCVYNDTGSSVTVTGLSTGTEYIAQVFEYNGASLSEKYLTTTATNNPKSQTTTAAPTITSFTPTSAGTGATVTITGTNFTGVTSVSFGVTVATSFSFVSSTSITAVVASGTTGTISVTTPGGTVTSGDTFTYIACSNPTDGGTIASDQTISSGSSPAAFTSSVAATGHTGTLEYKWQWSTTTATANDFADIGLSNSATYAPGALSATTWYKRLARVSCKSDWTGAMESNVVAVTVTPLPITVSGSNTKDGQYASLTKASGAFAALNSANQTGKTIAITITGDVTDEDGAKALTGALGIWTSLTINPGGGAARTISGTVAAPLIDLNGADNVSIEGLNTEGNALTISNTSTSATNYTSTIRFINDATNNTVKYCTLKGSSTATVSTKGGVLFFGLGSNSTNTIDHNNITNSDGINRPVAAIYSYGAGGINSGNRITNNNIYDFFNPTSNSQGIYIWNNSSDWTITGNNFYETSAPLAPTGAFTYDVIRIDGGSGNNFMVSDNFIGGSAADHTGTFTINSAYAHLFNGIYLSVGATTASSVQNNSIERIAYTTAGSEFFSGIRIRGGNVNAGTITGNTIGSTTGNGSITLTSLTAIAISFGIYNSGTGIVNIENNKVGAITTVGSATLAHSFYAIRSDYGTNIISNNTIGSISTSNSIIASSTSSANSQSVYGIYSGSTGTATISGNTIANLTNASTYSLGEISGINSAGGTRTITNNTVRDLTSANSSTVSVSGIYFSSNVAAVQTITGNTIYNLSNSYSSYSGIVIGLYYLGFTTASTVSKNFIHSLSATSANAALYGLRIDGGTATYSNNIISLGSGITTGNVIYGINLVATGSNTLNLYHNTIDIEGTASGVTGNTYALSNAGLATRVYKNNIFNNSRAGGTTGKHYAVSVSYNTNLTIDYNDYFAPNGMLGVYNSVNKTILTDWQTATGQDGHSLNVIPNFSAAGGTSATNYLPSAASLIAITGTGVSTDYGLNTRSSTYPAMGAWEYTVAPCTNPTGGGTIGSDQTIFWGSTPAAFTSSAGATGQSGTMEYKWQSSTTSSSTVFNDISSSNSETYAPVALSATTWYKRLARVSCKSDWTGAMESNVVAVTVTPLPITVSGSNTTDGQYASLTKASGAFAALNGADQTGQTITITITGDVTDEDGANALTGASGMWSTLTISPSGGEARTISCSVAAPLIDLNGADNVTIDGLNTDGNSLTISNLSTSATAGTSTIRFINEASANTVKYCTIKGSTLLQENGVILFSTASSGSGNSNNSITNCNITNAGGNRPYNAIFSSGSAGFQNSNNTIINNNFYDFIYCGYGNSTGIYISDYSNNWSITGNSFYETTPLVPKAGSYIFGIEIIANGDDNFTIANNFIGGSASDQSGTYTVSAAFNHNFFGIYLRVGATTASSVQNNTIKNFAYTTTSSNPWYGIYIESGKVNVGTLRGNTIGSTTGTNSIILTNTTKNATSYGIYVSSSDVVDIQNNNIGSISTIGSSSVSHSFCGIYKSSSAGTTSISNNLVGSLDAETTNSINASSTATLGAQNVYGIYFAGTGTNTISGNTIARINNSSTISARSTVGICYQGSATAGTVSGNFINSLSIAGTAGSVYGLQIVSGAATYSNNIISIGGSSTATIYGIYVPGTLGNDCNLYYNTVYIGGSLASGANKSYALYNSTKASVRDYRNNVFYNARSTTGGVSLHYAAWFALTGGSLTCDYNDYFVSGIGGKLSHYGVDLVTLPIVSGVTGNDANSKIINPAYSTVDATIPIGYMPTVTTLPALTGTGITTDFAAFTRTGAPTMGAYEYTVTGDLVTVTASAGTGTAVYSTLKAAFDAIDAGTHKGVISIAINSSITETASAVLHQSGYNNSTSDYSTVHIYPTVTGLTINGNLPAPLIDLDGADNVYIDGRQGGTGTTKDLIISNLSTSATAGTSTIRFINDASANTVKYCTIKGSTTSGDGGIISFFTTTGSTGNDGNTIDNNTITSSDNTKRPLAAIYSRGSDNIRDNSGNIISNNSIYNFLNTGKQSYGIELSQSNTAWTITKNNFYETGTSGGSFVPTDNCLYFIININRYNCNGGFTITDNNIGGSAPDCSGTWTKTAAFDNAFYGIYFDQVNTAPVNSVQGNTIKNINYANSLASNFFGINVVLGNVDIGTTTGNTIGASTGNSSITFTSNNISVFYGIKTSSTEFTNINNNIIGAITTANTNSTYSTNFYGIYKTAGKGTINNNTIGSTDPGTTNSINASSGSTVYAQSVYGINNEGSGAITISGNTISKLTNGTTNESIVTAGVVQGIKTTNGTNTITNNTVSYLTIANANTAPEVSASVAGIVCASTVEEVQTITGNTISNLSNSYASFGGYVKGLVYLGSGSTTLNAISRNFIHSLSVNSGSTVAKLYGIYISKSATTTANNIINIGGNTQAAVYGIYETWSSVSNIYFNTIYIGGSPTTGSLINSYALYSATTSNSRDFRNNIFYNARSNSGTSTSNHYGMFCAVGGSLTCNYNDYYVSGTGGILGYYGGDKSTPIIVTDQDANSISADPSFKTAVGTSAYNYLPSSNTLVAVKETGITADYGLNTRSSTYPAMGAWEYTVTPPCSNPTSGGTIASAQTICAGSTPAAFTSSVAATGHTGTLEYKWQWSTTSATANDFTDIATSNSTTYTPGALSTTTWFKRLVRVSCKSDWTGAVGSNVVAVTITPSVAASVSVSPSSTTVCQGTEVTFTATPTHGGTPTYQWYKGAGVITNETSSTYAYTPAVGNTDAITVQMTSTASCVTGSPATSNAVTVVVNAILPVSVAMAADANPVCAGTLVTFTATPTNGGTPTYQWYKGATAVGSGLATYAYTPTAGNTDAITVKLTSSETCKSGSPATSDAVTVVVNTILPVSVAMAADANPVCAGTSVTFTATPTNGGTPVYQWYNGTTAVGTGLATYAYTPTAGNTDAITVKLTSSETCKSGSPATSDAVTVVVNTILPVSVTMAADANPVCAGTSVTFTATPTNGGTPTYQWYNGTTAVGANSSTYAYTPTPGNSDQITVQMTSNATPCLAGSPATSSPAITITVNPTLTASVKVTSGAISPVSLGTEVTFSATPTNGGTAPTYQWYNGVTMIEGATYVTYAYTPKPGNVDVITVQMTSNTTPCLAGSPATSSPDDGKIEVNKGSSTIVATGTASFTYNGLVQGLTVQL